MAKEDEAVPAMQSVPKHAGAVKIKVAVATVSARVVGLPLMEITI